MNFFKAQEVARRKTLRLLVLFALAVLLLIIFTNLLILLAMAYNQTGLVLTNLAGLREYFQWDTFVAVAFAVLILVGGGSLFKTLQLSAGGRAIAEALGGRVIAQNSTDPIHRKILNVVEEMAIASGSPVPSVYLLEESGINAFAAGWAPGNAVIGITRGAVTQLNREELQGVIAHEFSHILNGDMRLNLRLIGILHGILLLGILGYYLMRSLRHARGLRSEKGGSAVAALFFLGLGLVVIGYVGTFFGNWIKAMVSRQREYLADAAAVQFTRNRDGIAGALKKIGALSSGSMLQSPVAPEFSHAYFAQGVSVFMESFFATHPSLKARIKRIDPRWDGKFIPLPSISSHTVEDAESDSKGNKQAHQLAAINIGAIVADTVHHAIENIGQPDESHLGYARELLMRVPFELRTEAQDPYGVRALIYALVLSPNVDIQKIQWKLLWEHADPGVVQKTEYLAPQVLILARQLRLPLIDLSMPALRELSTPQYQSFNDALLHLMHADNKIDLNEWIIQRIILQHLDKAHGLKKPAPAKYTVIAQVKAECELLLSLVAYAEHSDDAAATLAFDAGRKAIGASALQMIERNELPLSRLNEALDKLRLLRPLLKPSILKALVACVVADEHVTVVGVELLRAIAANLDCPMPPVMQT